MSQFPDTHHNVTHNTLFGFWVYLMTDFLLFATLFATLVVLQSTNYHGPTAQDLYSRTMSVTETIVLLVSCLTCAFALIAIREEKKNKVNLWLGCTALLGVLFLALVIGELVGHIQNGITWQTNAFLSAYFTLIATHALHIFVGLLFLAFFLFQTHSWGLNTTTIRRLNCFAMFWFFSYLVWVFMYSIIYLLKVPHA